MTTDFLKNFELIYFKDLLPYGYDIYQLLDHLSLPGFYGIHCLDTNRTYLTQCKSVAFGLQSDYRELYFDRFEGSLSLVSDMKKYGLKSLVFLIIKTGPQWEDFDQREKELKIIKKSWPLKSSTNP